MKRDLYWDSLKFVLIILVVYGHIVPYYCADSSFNMAIYNSIYMFHMPLFVFVSGRFSHIRDRQRYKKSIVHLLETYIVFQIIKSILLFFHGGEITIQCLTTPNWTLWYLVALIYWRLMIYVIPKEWLENYKFVLLVSFAISLLAGFIPVDLQFVIQRTLSFLPFFFLGYYSVNWDIISHIKKIPYMVSISILFVTFIIFYFILDRDLFFIHHCTYSYWTDDMTHTLIRFLARFVFILCSIVLSIAVMSLVTINSNFAKWGRITLFIYLYHTFAVREVLIPLIERNFIPQNEILLIIYAVIITFGLLFLSRVRFLTILLNPISYLFSNKQNKTLK